MSTQAPGGLKHAATEPAHLDNKRERRRGAAAGRAAALRRAPSDSDCSGETASLSADSAERVARPPPPAARSGKTRSRRRGSEWEVLEGLKDGQRFDRRPEVFNGYLHKKRKWPLKGWHKRFFVIDGGILVYARSPTDVARGRLHGSVDVGLSVISAKPRRRRIDIDADEFIYHLRAKTPDVFRTWLSVLKAHRLYRQHLLTFGARESVPKILAPLEDLPATDTSSHSTESNTTFTISSSSSEDLDEYPKPGPVIHSSPYFQDVTCYHTSVESGCHHTHVPIGDKEVTVERRSRNTESDKNKPNTRNDYRSLCSMKCMKMLVKDAHAYSNKSPEMSTDMENQVLSTNLDVTSLRSDDARLHSTLLCDNSNPPIPNSPKKEGKRLILFERPPTTLFLFGHKKRNHLNPDALAPMKKSRKCTNLVKYRNLIEEPTLKKPLSHNMLLLSKYKLNISKQYQASTDVQVQARNKASKYVQKTMTTSDCDLITDRLIRTVFARNRETYTEHDMTSVKRYIVQVIHELYDMKYHKDDKHPLKTLFRALLDYWIKNSTIEIAKEMHGKSINRPSNSYFTVDRNISSGAVCTSTKSTQIDHRDKTRHGTRIPEPKLKFNERPISDSQEKELRIQELERLLKNTVYICDTVLDSQSKEKDIKITKKLIDNLEKVSKELSNSGESNDNSNSSAEIPKIQETINHLISDASIPRVVAKEFLFAYLDVLLRDEDEDSISTSSSGKSKDSQEPLCDVQADCVQRVKRVSKSILVTNNSNDSENAHDKLPDGDDQLKGGTGQLYLKDIIDKITSIFKKSDEHVSGGDHEETEPGKVDDIKDEKKLPLKNYVGENIFDNHTEKSIVVGMSDYDLHNLPRINNPSSKGMMAVALQLRDKVNSKESRRANFSLKFSDVSLPISEVKSNTSQRRMQGLFRSHFDPRISFKNPYDCWPREKMVELRPFLSASDATSKAYFRGLRNSVNSFDFSIKDSVHPIPNYFDPPKGKAFEPQPCYVISAFQTEKLPNELHSGKKELVRDSISPHKGVSTSKEEDLIDKTPPESTVFDKTPKLIDEKFIVLLLENIALLSQALPNVHKEIESLYFKLRKKHEDSLNISSHKGLSLLGKIYNEQTTLNAHNVKTQFDKKMVGNRGSYDDFTPIIDTGVNTSYTELTERKKEKQFEDRCVSAYRLLKEINDYACQVSNMKIDCGTDMSNETRNVVGDNTLEKRENQAVSQKDAKYATGEPDKYVRKDYIEKKNAKIHPIPPFITSSNVSSVKGMKTMRTVLEETLYREENSDTIHGSQNLNPLASILSAPSIEEVEVINSKYWCEVQDNVRRFGKIIKDYLKNSGTNLEYAMPDLVEDGDYTEPNSVEVVVKEQPKPPKPDRVDKQSSAIKRELYKELGAFIPTCKVSTESQTDKRFVMHVKNKKAIETDYAVYQLFVSNRYGCTKSSSTMSILTTDISDDVFNLFRSSSDTHIHESGGPLESASRSLGQAAVSVAALRRLLDALDLHQHHHDTDVSLEGAAASPNVKKDRRKFGLRKKKSNSKCASVELAPPLLDGSASHMTLSALTAPPSPGGGASSAPSSAASLPIACAAARPQSLPGAESLAAAAGPASLTSLTPDQQLREDFTVLAKDLVATLKGVVSTLVCERGRLRAAMDASEAGAAAAPPAVLAALRTNLNSALQQNSELRSRLSRIHDASDLAEISSVNISDPATRQFQQSLSYSSSCVSASEFFDAEEHDDDAPAEDGLPGDEAGVIELDGDSSSEAGSLSSEDGSATSDNSEVLSAEPITLRLAENGSSIEPHSSGWARRTRLPCPRPTPGGPSLWNLLYKNIGKDLSQISMPVTINEPLNMLQRLCEELEYSELLDSASQCQEPLERAALVAAFAVSAYAAAAHRAASKPFNPLLAETYECSRDDKGFQFIAEQVSHHPPVSVCYAQSSRWVVWQEARIKTRFWGKSMEFQPAGKVHLRLLPSGDHYSWNKVTTCVHNLFGGQRWVDQYGDMLLACHDSDVSAKLNFIKASSWSSSRHEVRGAVVDGSGRRLRLQGRWSEALYAGDPPAARCLWRPGAMPAEHESYYGFTRFAMELNEMEPGMREALPHTDTRFRPDQRALEEGRIEAAERYKHELEQAQRERRRDSPEHTPVWFRKSVEEGQECWSFAGEYWKARAAGFPALPAPRLW